MPEIQLLDQKTINEIAAGEVIDRPASIVKELLENAIDAHATAITVEIKEGGISLIRITDNGEGIRKEEIPLAFLRHSTSKIKSMKDLETISSLGFRGEALSSICAVSKVELITKQPSALTGVRYQIEGGKEKQMEEVGVPSGTTFIVRNIFYNTPARYKFLKTAATEAGYIGDIVEKIALSRPDISIRFMNNNQNKVFTSGNGNVKDVIYSIYGKEIAANLLEVQAENEFLKIEGYLGKPIISRGNRNYETYFINGRYIKNRLIAKAVEDAYKPYRMQHQYPFTTLFFTISPALFDVNVHPSKMELRFRNEQEIYPYVTSVLSEVLARKELILQVEIGDKTVKEQQKTEVINRNETEQKVIKVQEQPTEKAKKPSIPEPFEEKRNESFVKEQSAKEIYLKEAQQLELFDDKLLSKEARAHHKIIGQIFDTYWLVEYEDKLFIIDQHAAHEKVLYEQTIQQLKQKEHSSQMLNPPIILTLSLREEELLKKIDSVLTKLGFEIEPFGGREYAVRAVPHNLYSLGSKEVLMDLLDSLCEETNHIGGHKIEEKIASMSCKAAVKGGNTLSLAEIDKLIEQLLHLENPYHCPHGRPTIISMSKYELEKKFKRII